MSALRKYKGLSKGGGLIQVDALDLPAGEELQVVLIAGNESPEDLAAITADWMLSGFSSVWDGPEEDEAWKDL